MTENDYACIDAEGVEYPDHTDDDVCRRCDAEMGEEQS